MAKPKKQALTSRNRITSSYPIQPTWAANPELILTKMKEGAYLADPALAAKDQLGIDLDSWQKDVITTLFRGEKKRVSVRAGHGTGKTMMAAVLAHIFLNNFPQSRILATGPCVEENEKILLADGRWTPIKDLSGRYFGVLAVDNNLKAVPALAYAFPNGVKVVYCIKTRSGREALRTGNHPFRTLSGWTQAINLKPKDFIAVPTDLPAHGQQSLPSSDVKIIAYLIAEGCTSYRNGKVTFAQTPGVVLNEFRECVEEKGCHLRKVSDRQYAITGLTPTGGRPINPVIELYVQHNLFHKESFEKSIPPAIFELKDDLVKIFISRLFAGDGYVRTNNGRGGMYEIGYYTTSKELVHDLSRLIMRFGIAGRIRIRKRDKIRPGDKAKRDLYHWYVNGTGAEKFTREIGVFSKEKDIQVMLNSWRPTRKKEILFDMIPPEPSRQIMDLLRVENKGRLRLVDFGIKAGTNRISKERLKKVAQKLEIEDRLSIWTGTVAWDEVVSVEPVGERMTYSIEVPGFNTYVTDFIEHNTSRQTRLQLWGYMNQVWQTNFLRNKIEWLKTKMYIKGYEESWFAAWVTSKNHKNAEGFHGENLLWLIEEAKSVQDAVFEAVQGALSQINNFIYISSTCGSPLGYFYETHTSRTDQWDTFHIPSWKSPRVSPEKIERWRREWGEDSPIYLARVAAEFPEESMYSIVPMSHLLRAVESDDDDEEGLIGSSS